MHTMEKEKSFHHRYYNALTFNETDEKSDAAYKHSASTFFLSHLEVELNSIEGVGQMNGRNVAA